MKTIIFILIFYFPILAFGQSALDASKYPIIASGEQFLSRQAADSGFLFAQNLLSQKKLSAFDRTQALYVAGRSKFELGAITDAIDYFDKTIALAKKNKFEPPLLYAYIANSKAYGDTEDPDIDAAKIYLKEINALSKKLQDTSGQAYYYIYAANISHLERDYKAAYELNNTCAQLLESTNNYNLEKAKNYFGKAINLMEIYIDSEKKDELLEVQISYKKSISIFQKLGKTIELANARNSLADSYLYSANLEDARAEAIESINLGALAKDTATLINGYYTLTTAYEMLGDATEAKKALIALNDYLDMAGTDFDMAFMKTQFGNADSRISKALIKSKIDIFDKQIENKAVLLASQQIALKNQRYKYSLMILGALIIGLLGYFFQRNRIQTKNQELLQEEIKGFTQSREIEYMQAMLEGEEKGRHRIARQIHDGVGGLLISTKWNLESALEELPKNEKKVATRLQENLKLQEHSYLELRRVMYELEKAELPWWEALQKFCEQVAQHKNVLINYYPYNLDESADEKLGEEVRLVIQELITNALKHAKASEINIQVSLIEGELDVIVEDNGIGFDKQKIIKGIGMKSIEDRVKRLGGKYSIESKQGAGTIVFMDVPLKTAKTMQGSSSKYVSAN